MPTEQHILLFVDYNMPSFTGPEFAKLARAEFRKLPPGLKQKIFFVLYSCIHPSGGSTVTIADKVNLLKADDGQVVFDNYLEKPATIQEISEILATYHYL